MVVEAHDDHLVEHLQSDSSAEDVWSDLAIPDDVDDAQCLEQLDLQPGVLVEHDGNTHEQDSSCQADYDVELGLLVSVVVDVHVHGLVSVLERSIHHIVSISLQPY